MAKKGKGKGRCVVAGLIGLVLMGLVGCANSSRNLTVNVEDGASFIIYGSTISPEVVKDGNSESPTATPDLELNMPFVPVP